MNQHPHKTIKTPISKTEVVLKDWITGAEYEEIQKPITDIKIMIDTLGTTKGEVNAGDATRKSTEKAVEMTVVSIGGEDTDILAKVKGLHKTDYLFVLAEVDKVVKGDAFTKPA